MADIWGDPVKRVMLIIIVILEVSSIVSLIYLWRKAKKEKENA